jgi:hypothetical protein
MMPLKNRSFFGVKFTRLDSLFKKKLIEICIILVLGFFVLNWFGGNYFLKCIDGFYGLNPEFQFNSSLYLWQYSYSVGYSWSLVSAIPVYGLWVALTKLGFSLVVSQKIMYYLIFTGAMLSMYTLSSTIFPADDLPSSVARLFSSLFYVANGYTLAYLWRWQPWWQFSYILCPIVFAVILRSTTCNTKQFGFLLLFSSMAVSVLSPLGLLGNFVIAIGSLMLIAYILLRGKKRIFFVKRIILLVIAWILCSLWWLIPNVYLIQGPYYTGVASFQSASSLLAYLSQYSTTLNTARLLGIQQIYLTIDGHSFYPWVETYLSNPIFVGLSFLPPVLAYLGLLVRRKRSDFILFFAILATLSIFLMKGSAEPLGWINVALLKLPFGGVFQSPYYEFAMLLTVSFSIMISSAMIAILNFRSKIHVSCFIGKHLGKVTVAVLIFLIVGVFMYPIWNGEVIPDAGSFVPGSRVIIPSYYYQASEWLSSVDDSPNRVLALPISTDGSAYNWENTTTQPNTDPILEYFLNDKSIIMLYPDIGGNYYSELVTESLSNAWLYPPSYPVGPVLALWNIKYIVIQNDWDTEFMQTQGFPYSPLYYEMVLRSIGPINSPTGAATFDQGSTPIDFQGTRDLNISRGLTIGIWVKPQNISSVSTVLGNDIFRLTWQSGAFQFWFAGTPIAPEYSNVSVDSHSNATLIPGIWYYLIVTYNQDSLRLYINGFLMDEYDSPLGVVSTSNTDLFIGNSDPALTSALPRFYPNQPFYGEVGNVEVFDNALSPSEVEALSVNGSININPVYQFNPEPLDYTHFRIKDVQEIGQLTFYEADNCLPLIYPSATTIVLPGTFNFSALASALSYSSSDLSSNPAFFFTEDQPKSSSLEVLQNFSYTSFPNLNFKMIDPTKYEVAVNNASSPFFLVFSESFDPGWQACIDGNEAVKNFFHYVANGFANAWYINKTGDFTITLTYWPQNLVNIGFYISIGTLLIIIIIIIILPIVRKFIKELASQGWMCRWKPKE